MLPRATAHGHQTFPDYGRHTQSRSKGGDVREEAPAEESAAKTSKRPSAILDLRRKYTVLPGVASVNSSRPQPTSGRHCKMAAGRSFGGFRRALLGRGFFAHVAPLRSRLDVASVIWESLVSMRRCSREHFADNRSAQSYNIEHWLTIFIAVGSVAWPGGWVLRLLA